MSEKITTSDDRLGSRSEQLQSVINAAKLCPVEQITNLFSNTEIGRLCQSCPNRSPSQAEAEMREALEELYDLTEPPPDKNCSCHVLPPCNDCVDHDGMRNALDMVRAVLAKYQKGGAT